MALKLVKDAKGFSNEVCKRMQSMNVYKVDIVLLTKTEEIVASIVDFKNAYYQEW